jgi:hypothetical protein
MTNDEKEYDAAELSRLWKLKYEELALAPGERGARLREARFILQVKVAHEAHRVGIVMVWATVVMAVATIVMAVK